MWRNYAWIERKDGDEKNEWNGHEWTREGYTKYSGQFANESALTWAVSLTFVRRIDMMFHHLLRSLHPNAMTSPETIGLSPLPSRANKILRKCLANCVAAALFRFVRTGNLHSIKKNEILLMSNYVRRRRSVCDLRFVSGLIKNFIHSKRRH